MHSNYSDSDSDSDSDDSYRLANKFKIIDEDSSQPLDKSSIIYKYGSYFDEIENETFVKRSRKNYVYSSDESSSYNENEYDDSESEDYVPISDSEFELEKCIINDENCETKTNEKTDNESVKDIECKNVDDDCDTDEKTTSNKSGVTEIDEVYDILDEEFQDKNDNPDGNQKKSVTKDEVYDLLDEEFQDKNDNPDGNQKKSVTKDEVYDLLDEVFQDKNDNPDGNKKKGVTKDDFKEYEKIVLEDVYKNHFDILPENWIEATHKSGMPIYLHKKTRVVTLSRPYFLGPGDAKSHLAPLSAISCLQYRKGIESKETLKNEPDFQASKLGDMVIPNAKVETAQENIVKESLTHVELREYCQTLFKFKKVKHNRKKRRTQNVLPQPSDIPKSTKERPSLPDSTKLISFPVQTEDHDKRCNRRREWIMNPNGKSYVSILHEYLQQALKTQPWYEFKELDDPETPYSATVVLNDVQYGVGLGNSKKQAKLNAAQATLDILIPEMKNKIDSDHKNQNDPVIFDQIKVTDPRVTEFCAKTTEPSPYAMLLVCLQRNFGECEIGIEYKLNNRRRMLNQCTMTVGEHTASVACKNKRDGKQKASQVILGLLHPHVDNWGSLLRLYGNRSIKNAKEKKQEEQEITQLQSKAAVNQPNFAILDKLKLEMLKIRDQRKLKESKAASGLPQSGLSTACPYTIAMPSASNSD